MTLFAKSPTQMRREAERRQAPASDIVSGKIDRSKLPELASETPDQQDAAAAWLAHVDAGRIAVK